MKASTIKKLAKNLANKEIKDIINKFHKKWNIYNINLYKQWHGINDEEFLEIHLEIINLSVQTDKIEIITDSENDDEYKFWFSDSNNLDNNSEFKKGFLIWCNLYNIKEPVLFFNDLYKIIYKINKYSDLLPEDFFKHYKIKNG